jgi:protein-disulfide isomerase
MSSREQAKAEARAEREAAEQDAAVQAARTQRLRLLGGVLVAAVAIVVVVIVISSGGGKTKATATPTTSAAVTGAAASTALLKGIPQQGMVLGSPKAPVTLVEYADLKCPICRDFSAQTFPAIVRKYVRTGKVRVVYRVQTFVGAPGDSLRAAKFGVSVAKQNRFWNYENLFYRNQGNENSAYVTDPFLKSLGGAIPGLNVSAALAGRTASAVSARISADSAAFDAAGFTGTPSFELGRSGSAVTPYALKSFDPAVLGQAIDKLL